MTLLEQKPPSQVQPSGVLSNCLCIVDLDNQNKFKGIQKELEGLRLQNVAIIGVGGPRLAIPSDLAQLPEVSFRNTHILSKDAADIELAVDAYKFVKEHASIYTGLEGVFRIRVFSTDFALGAIVEILKRETGLEDVSFHCDFLEWIGGQKE